MTQQSQGWGPKKWTQPRLKLVRAMREATFRESRHAPMSRSLGPGNTLLRHVGRARALGSGIPQRIEAQQALKLIEVFDGKLDQNRFTGPVTDSGNRPLLEAPKRGGLYCSADIRASIAEMLHYANGNLSRELIGSRERLMPSTLRCFLSLRPTRELDVVNLVADAPGMLEFLARLQRDPAVAAALPAAGHQRGLFAAVFGVPPPGKHLDLSGLDPEVLNDYSAARGLGLGLQDNTEIDGIELLSARDFATRVGAQEVMRTGDNVVLFARSGEPARDLVRIQAIHLVDEVPGSPELLITHYAGAAGGSFVKSGDDRFVP